MKYQSYPEYKDSGVEWLGEVPEHWVHTKLKYTTTRIVDGTHFTPTYTDNGIPFLRVTDIHNEEIDLEKVKFISEVEHKELIKRCHPEIGDLLLSKNGTIGLTKIVTWDWDFSIFVSLCCIRPKKEKILPNFLAYIFHSKEVEDQITGTSKKTSVTNLHLDKIGEIVYAIPPIPEQTVIAEFLNRETKKIDYLITKQQKLIELLQEKRQVIISYAVTKGINPDVKMKDSGVEWLGEVPEHWGIKRFSYVSVIVRGGSPRPAGDPELFHGNYSPWVTVAEITKDNKLYLDSTETFLTKKGSDQCRVFKAGTLLISNSGATLGVPKILTINANANDGVVGFEHLDKNIVIEFAYFYLSSLTENLRDRIKQGAGQPNLNTDIVKELQVCVPPIEEQLDIVLFIQKSLSKIDKAQTSSDSLTKLLQERRIALISSAVTGKIDVRNA